MGLEKFKGTPSNLANVTSRSCAKDRKEPLMRPPRGPPLANEEGIRTQNKSLKGQERPLRYNRQELLSIEIIPGSPEKTTRIGSQISEETKKELVQCLQRNADIFAWTPQNLEGIDPRVTTHHLNMDPNIKPVKQRRGTSGPKRIE
ncbi:UNVERIFIED_CONTAM: hypothetical protein Slati_4184100 [Sesamum latifolium]|uniref:Reverse transcriptase domain-containing protein n=1 Tax=Sesamum latifolium TaxID=2727402 RepID=A0AAW2TB88_9LAMI